MREAFVGVFISPSWRFDLITTSINIVTGEIFDVHFADFYGFSMCILGWIRLRTRPAAARGMQDRENGPRVEARIGTRGAALRTVLETVLGTGLGMLRETVRGVRGTALGTGRGIDPGAVGGSVRKSVPGIDRGTVPESDPRTVPRAPCETEEIARGLRAGIAGAVCRRAEGGGERERERVLS